jgi:hypothetical protein
MVLDEIVYENDKIDSDSDCTLFRFVVSNIREWRTFINLRLVEILNRLVDLNEIVCNSDSDSMLLRLVVSTIPKWRTFNFLRRVQFFSFLLICMYLCMKKVT